MKRVLMLGLVCLWFAGCLRAQRAFEGFFTSSELNVRCQLNLYADSVAVPGMEGDVCYGYLEGALNGMWVILRVDALKGSRASVRAVSDQGIDAQNLELSVTDEGLSVRLMGDINMKGVKGRKYVKLPKPFTLERMGSRR